MAGLCFDYYWYVKHQPVNAFWHTFRILTMQQKITQWWSSFYPPFVSLINTAACLPFIRAATAERSFNLPHQYHSQEVCRCVLWNKCLSTSCLTIWSFSLCTVVHISPIVGYNLRSLWHFTHQRRENTSMHQWANILDQYHVPDSWQLCSRRTHVPTSWTETFDVIFTRSALSE